MSELNLQELLDRAALAADARWPGTSVTDVEPLHGGISSLTFSARLRMRRGADARVVLKVAPPGLAPVRNRDVLRQAKVMRSLRLHQLDPAAVGLGDEPAIPLAHELERWVRLFSTAGDDLPHDEAELRRQLAASLPKPVAPRVLHGDYRLGNMQFAGDHLAALIDWEIWSVGDPRTDLAWLLVYTDPVQRFVEQPDTDNQAAADAMPDRDALLEGYLAVRRAEVPNLPWFLAYCYDKMAATTAVLIKQNRRRPRPDPALIAASSVPAVIDRGREMLELVGFSSSPRPAPRPVRSPSLRRCSRTASRRSAAAAARPSPR